MNLQWLIYFQTIAELENYTQATKKLHVSQSNLSHAMRSLEEKLGVELFEKDGRNIRLSKYGEIFLPYVNKTLDSLDEGIAKLKEFLDPNTGTCWFSFRGSVFNGPYGSLSVRNKSL